MQFLSAPALREIITLPSLLSREREREKNKFLPISSLCEGRRSNRRKGKKNSTTERKGQKRL